MWSGRIAAAAERLAAAGVASPLNDARELAEFVAGSVPVGTDSPTTDEARAFDAAVERRAAREPLQHIIGTMWFRYLTLVSRPGVFIVRPETEMVVEAGLTALKGMDKPAPVVVDLCTGSGAIAISIATEYPQARVFAVELSEIAFEAASENNETYGNLVTLALGDARTEFEELLGNADLVICNPPYVPPHHELSAEVLRDPAGALYGGGPDGLDIPQQLVERAFALLRPGGILVMEHADDQGEALRAAAHRFVNVGTGQDLAGRDRWLYAQKPLDLQADLAQEDT